jgi:hypothetical protein
LHGALGKPLVDQPDRREGVPRHDDEKRRQAHLLEARAEKDGEVEAAAHPVLEEDVRQPDLLARRLEARGHAEVADAESLDGGVERAHGGGDALRRAGLIAGER